MTHTLTDFSRNQDVVITYFIAFNFKVNNQKVIANCSICLYKISSFIIRFRKKGRKPHTHTQRYYCYCLEINKLIRQKC